VRLAVVVQRIVETKVAGVLFTANPVTGKRREVTIDDNPGLGEAAESGATNPDHFVIQATGEIIARQLGDKQVQIRRFLWFVISTNGRTSLIERRLLRCEL
jgi:pyruvate,water dikinase